MTCPRPLKIVAEKNVPFLGELEEVAEVVRLPYGEITREAVRDADALIVRTRNRCDASLLEGSRVRLVATATIGTDHIDLGWCGRAGIEVANAPGSNAPGVAQYVLSSVAHISDRPLSELTIGVVGVGHVGSLVASRARSLGMRVLMCDPPRRDAEGGDQWSSLAEIAAQADVITFHTPLDADGEYPTVHLADRKFFDALRRRPIIVNSARGGVVDTDAWVEAIANGKAGKAVVDCWEGEPMVDGRLLDLAAVATPHIAGYSLQGKMRASQMALDAVCRHFGLGRLSVPGGCPPPGALEISLDEVMSSYDPAADTAALRAHPEDFEKLRNNYHLREE